MIDIHTHILANLDDGANDMSESLKMAKQAHLDGISRLVCTPHIHQGYFDNSTNNIRSAYKLFIKKLSENNCPLNIAYSAEVRICPEIIEWLESGQIPLMGQWQGKKVLLLELPHSHIPPGTEHLIKWLIDHDFQPLIAHPERNRDILSDYSKVKYLENIG
jgi:protein-tyrosine phosphatase